MQHSKLYIAIDIGGTNVRVASLRSLEKPIFLSTENFALSHVFDEDFGKIISIIKGMAGQEQIEAIGVGMPGSLNPEKTSLIHANNIPEWMNMEVKTKLMDCFHSKVYLENDAVTSALGEALYNNHQTEDFIFIIWGTGVGGAVVKTKPKLKATKLEKEDYLQDLRLRCYAKFIMERYGKPPWELSQENWAEIMADFETLMIHISDRFKIKNMVIGGGIAQKQSGLIYSLASKLKSEHGINFQITNMGDNHTFGLYGASALLLHYPCEDAEYGRE